MDNGYFSQAFLDGNVLLSGPVEVVMTHCGIGEIALPSGQVVACDPIHLHDLDPFLQQVPPGSYPVVLSIARASGSEVQRVALAMLRISGEMPVRWQVAVKARPNGDKTTKDQSNGYEVDVGLGSFMDLEAARLLQANMEADDRFHDYIFESVEENKPEWANIPLSPAAGLNIAVFSAGFGDGSYLSYWGYGESKNVACLVTDFQILGEAGESGSTWAW
jgi:hypothetical protein